MFVVIGDIKMNATLGKRIDQRRKYSGQLFPINTLSLTLGRLIRNTPQFQKHCASLS